MKKIAPIYWLVIAYGIIVCVLSLWECWMFDDIEYQFMALSREELGNRFGEMGTVPIQNFADVLVSQYHHYFNINGRTPAHILVQSFCGLWGQEAFAVCNGIVHCLFLLMIMKVAGIRAENKREVFLTVLIATFALGTTYGPACQIGYFWMFTAALCVLYLFYRFEAGLRLSAGWLIGLFFLCFLAGWGQEALNFGLCGSFLIYCAVRRSRIPREQWVLIVAFCLGALLIALSPAAWERAEGMNIPLKDSAILFLKWSRCSYLLTVYAFYLIVFHKKSALELYKREFLLINAWLLMIVFNFVIGIFTNRQLFGAELLALLITLRWLMHYRIRKKLYLGVLLLFTCLAVFITTKRLHQHFENRQLFERELALCLQAAEGEMVNVHVNKQGMVFDIERIEAVEEFFAKITKKKTGKDIKVKVVLTDD